MSRACVVRCLCVVRFDSRQIASAPAAARARCRCRHRAAATAAPPQHIMGGAACAGIDDQQRPSVPHIRRCIEQSDAMVAVFSDLFLSR